MKKLNNKGFTLVELIAVVAILLVIMSIAIPNISSSIERTRNKQNKAKKDFIITSAELYISKNKGSITTSPCYIMVQTLIDEDYIGESDISEYTSYYIKYTKPNTLELTKDSGTACK